MPGISISERGGGGGGTGGTAVETGGEGRDNFVSGNTASIRGHIFQFIRFGV